METLEKLLALEALDEHARRRSLRNYLRGYMKAYTNYFEFRDDLFLHGLAQFEIIAFTQALQFLGFTRFSKLRKHARRVRQKNAAKKLN